MRKKRIIYIYLQTETFNINLLKSKKITKNDVIKIIIGAAETYGAEQIKDLKSNKITILLKNLVNISNFLNNLEIKFEIIDFESVGNTGYLAWTSFFSEIIRNKYEQHFISFPNNINVILGNVGIGLGYNFKISCNRDYSDYEFEFDIRIINKIIENNKKFAIIDSENIHSYSKLLFDFMKSNIDMQVLRIGGQNTTTVSLLAELNKQIELDESYKELVNKLNIFIISKKLLNKDEQKEFSDLIIIFLVIHLDFKLKRVIILSFDKGYFGLNNYLKHNCHNSNSYIITLLCTFPEIIAKKKAKKLKMIKNPDFSNYFYKDFNLKIIKDSAKNISLI